MQLTNKNTDRFVINTYLPHNFLAEKIVLSSLLNSKEALNLSLNNLATETFYFKNHQEIYRTITLMHKKKNSSRYNNTYNFFKR